MSLHTHSFSSTVRVFGLTSTKRRHYCCTMNAAVAGRTGQRWSCHSFSLVQAELCPARLGTAAFVCLHMNIHKLAAVRLFGSNIHKTLVQPALSAANALVVENRPRRACFNRIIHRVSHVLPELCHATVVGDRLPYILPGFCLQRGVSRLAYTRVVTRLLHACMHACIGCFSAVEDVCSSLFWAALLAGCGLGRGLIDFTLIILYNSTSKYCCTMIYFKYLALF